MLTEDLTIPTDGSWLTVALTTTQTIVFNGSGIDVMYRFGAGSTSTGMRLNCNDTMAVQEAIYVKPIDKYIGSTQTFKLTVTR